MMRWLLLVAGTVAAVVAYWLGRDDQWRETRDDIDWLAEFGGM